MSNCTVQREVSGSTAQYRVNGKFEGASAWELCGRLQKEALSELTLDFSQVAEFVDYGVAVLANALLSLPSKRVNLKGLRQHQLRLFKYFGVDADDLVNRGPAASDPSDPFGLQPQPFVREVA